MEWRLLNDPPEQNGYVLLAITHHNIPMVLEGFCKIREDGARFTEQTYNGNGVAITHWMPLPKHPYIK